MSDLKRPGLPLGEKTRQPRRCGFCGSFGHDRRKCDQVPVAPMPPAAQTVLPQQNPVRNPEECPPFVLTEVQYGSLMDWERVVYVVFDLETTGVKIQEDKIIEIAAVILDKKCIPIEDARFAHFVKPRRQIPQGITQLTSITNEMVQDADRFEDIWPRFLRFMTDTANACSYEVDRIILVGHNSGVFHIPFLLHQICRYNLEGPLFEDN